MTAAWVNASARRWGETWIPKYQRPLCFARRREGGKIPGGGGFGHVPLDPKGVEFGFLASFFSTSFKQTKTNDQEEAL